MKTRVVLAACVVAALAGWVAAPGFTEDEPSGGRAGASPWELLAKRGPQHEWLGFMVGSWNAGTKSWEGPGEPHTSTGRMESHWIQGRRFVRSIYSGEVDGKPFRGEATMGFNNATQKFETAWISTWGTGISRSEGTRTGNVVTLGGTTTVPRMGEVTYRTLYTKKSDDEYLMEEFWTIEGQGEVKVLEITYTRAN